MKKAFTLIELLIVIAIIGILAGIVLVSLTGALKKGKDSRIQADLKQVQSIAGMIMTDEGGYDSLCAGGTLNENHSTYGSQLGAIESDISAQGSTDLKCYASSTEYCVAAKLVSKENYYYCIDSDGNALSTSTTANPCTSASSKCR